MTAMNFKLDTRNAMVASLRRRGRLGGMLLLAGLMSGCATGPNANPQDPLEPFNRGVYQFNEAVDTAVLKPVATAYRDGVPRVVRLGVGNFFGNLQDAWSAVNNALQLKGQGTSDSVGRVLVNTVIGVGGLFDVASDLGIEKQTKDFGHTLGYWGVGPGPYVVLPFLGSSTLRDTVALPVDSHGDLVANVAHVPTRNTALALRIVDQREGLIQASEMLERIALDKYAFVRDAHLQRRRSAVYDGNPPDDAFQDAEPVLQPKETP